MGNCVSDVRIGMLRLDNVKVFDLVEARVYSCVKDKWKQDTPSFQRTLTVSKIGKFSSLHSITLSFQAFCGAFLCLS